MSELRDVLRTLAAGAIPREIPADCGAAAELAQLAEYLGGLTTFVRSLSAGELSAQLDLRGPLAGALKALQSDLRHLTWQTQQVAAGDFTQRVAFLGEFSTAFNRMVAALAEARDELVAKNQQLVTAYEGLKMAEVQLLQREKMASVGQLAAGIAHEINNPMGFISSNLGTLHAYSGAVQAHLQLLHGIAAAAPVAERSAAEVSRRERDVDFILSDLPILIEESLAGAKRVQGIVQNLMSFAQVNAADTRVMSINDCIESTVKAAEGVLGSRIVVVRDYGDGCEVECLPKEMGEMFMNLLLNASEAISGKGEVSIATKSMGGHVTVTIEDTGCGIPTEIMGRIFEPFFTTKPVGKNRGLGLAMVFQTVAKHGGAIDVESNVGRGTCFRVLLPRQGITQGEAVAR